MHIGHAFSYTQADLFARFWRMRGKEVFYPVGWDDNGLPTERRVQNYYGVRCDPALPYDPDFTPPPPLGPTAPPGPPSASGPPAPPGPPTRSPGPMIILLGVSLR